ncbi:3-hydroxyisobutyrate dehydrogenase [Asticcacaulis sp. BYS171W]|uniref:3-hydroxyisobutyrate dehydrogenase n=1 Tax=Asticcacaulis aquaticus TaxID=2984212 RepID=A0ABT5HW98_9CAUL|nr:3-hydroxyisobutyrate dehydrogenase [Asticcacaulis aquaticus]MDC7683706.1 3-hydroxyisobutyrate dehydrogenase [Asticcacaulis aquaticus]
MTTVAFIGLGHMGSGMAVNLVRAGHTVRAFDLDESAVAEAQGAGAIRTLSVAEACEGAGAVITMLPAAAHVRQVHDIARRAAPASALLIDCSTIDVGAAREVAQAAQDAGLAMLDAPVSGGVAAAKAGALTFMCGGTVQAFARGEPLLSAMGKAVIHAGASGAGQAAKICNNLLLGISMIGTCEAFGLAEKLGLEAQVFFDIASKASGRNWALTDYCPVPGPLPSSPANRDYQAGFTAALMLKDLNLAVGAAEDNGAHTPLGTLARAMYEALCADGFAARDFSVMMPYLRDHG